MSKLIKDGGKLYRIRKKGFTKQPDPYQARFERPAKRLERRSATCKHIGQYVVRKEIDGLIYAICSTGRGGCGIVLHVSQAHPEKKKSDQGATNGN